MAGERKLFLKRLAEAWKTEFPFFKPIFLGEAGGDPKGSTFLCEDYYNSRKVFYFFQVDFSPRQPGEFSASIHVSPNRERKGVPTPPDSTVPTPTSVGLFAIWHFTGQPRFSWALLDSDGAMDALLSKAGGEPLFADLPGRRTFVWKPRTYRQPIEKTIAEAIDHLTSVVREHVLPKLSII